MHHNVFGNEDDLPRVPLPSLADSCRRFLVWCTPLLTVEERATTEQAVDDLLRPDSVAHTLQAALERYRAGPGVHSWLDEFWSDRYLGRRDRIALNANFFFLFSESGLDQVDRAASLITGALDYKRALDAGEMPSAEERGHPVSMEQHKYLFSSTRIPGLERDTTRTPYSVSWPGPSQERHIVVLFGGNMFRVEVIGPGGEPHTCDEIAAALHHLMAERPGRGAGVGALTTKARAEWARSRQALLDCDPANEQALNTIETALFSVCLEDTDHGDTPETCAQLLHGDPGNRWFDKSVSFVVFPAGTAGVNVEHSRLDGTTILTFVDALLDRTSSALARQQGEPECRPIEFVLDGDLGEDVRAAAHDFLAYADATATELLSFDEFGAERTKSLDISPDAFVQLAYQLALQRAKGRTGATYESITTRQFHYGRTEAMRVVTREVLRFVAAMDNLQADTAACRAALRAAATAHVERAKQCRAGQAPEQHLWELQLLQRRHGGQLGAAQPLALFDSPGWHIMREDYLSTSSAPSAQIRHFGFGSTSDHCIGIAYVLLPDRLNVHLSTPRPVAEQMHRFSEELRRAITEMQDLLAGRAWPDFRSS